MFPKRKKREKKKEHPRSAFRRYVGNAGCRGGPQVGSRTACFFLFFGVGGSLLLSLFFFFSFFFSFSKLGSLSVQESKTVNGTTRGNTSMREMEWIGNALS